MDNCQPKVFYVYCESDDICQHEIPQQKQQQIYCCTPYNERPEKKKQNFVDPLLPALRQTLVDPLPLLKTASERKSQTQSKSSSEKTKQSSDI
jgi:hypothetical protein